MDNDFLNSTRMTQRQQRELLRTIEQASKPVEESNRKHDRIEYHVPDVRLKVAHPDGEVAKFLVCCRNISTGGISFLHGGFLYPGSRCEFTLPTVWGGEEVIFGKVATCRHIEKQTHEFGVTFDSMIDRRRFITLPGERALESEPEKSKIASLAGRLLMIDACAINVDLARHHIKESNVEIIGTETAAEGIVVTRSEPIDALLLDIDEAEAEPGEMIREFREAGYKGPIVATTADPDSTRSAAALDAGADEIVGRPLSASNMVRVLTECLSGCASSMGPIRCQLENDPGAIELVANYLEYVETLVDTLTKGIEAEDADSVLKVCLAISQSANGYGFPPLEQAANDAAVALRESMSINEAIGELQRFSSACKRLEPIVED